MSADARTIAVYDARSPDYARMVSAWNTPGLETFAAALPPGGRVLDLGAGPGEDAQKLMQAGLRVTAWDASAAMVATARASGVKAHQASFDDLTATASFDGIWANFSLLHAPRADLPRHLSQIHKALNPGGLFHIGMKLGTGEARDALGRFYSYYSEAELDAYLARAGFTPVTRARRSGKGLSGEHSPWIWILSHG